MAMIGSAGRALGRSLTLVDEKPIQVLSADTLAKYRPQEAIMQITNPLSVLTYISDYVYPEPGMSPKEYGQRYGHGNRQRKTNLKRCAERAKINRRNLV